MATDRDVRRLIAGDGGSSLVLPPAAGDPLPAAPAPAEPAVLTPAGRRGALSGQAWQDFLIGDLVAAGGMGEVYRAVQRPMGRVVALKVLPEGAAVEHLVRFAAEARAAASLRHPHVVAVHASGERDGRAFLAMEFADGGSLAGLLARHRAEDAPPSPFAAADLAWQAAEGLAAAHAAGLVHRDLKPDNLLLMADGTLKVADFGLVRFLDAHQRTLAGTVLGTPLYMAPEQGRGLPASPAADIYSLGCVLYELLTLRPPFAGSGSEELVLQHNYREPPLPSALAPGIPPGLEAVCLKCLQKDPAARFADAQALAGDLARLRAGLAPLSALFPPGRLGTGAEEALRRLAGRRARWPWAAAALLAAAGAGGWWWWDARKTETAQVRARLAPLAAAAPAPATAPADLERLARLAGAGDPQVERGRARLAEFARLHAALAALDGRLDDPRARAEAAALLDALDQASGGGDGALAPWRARLAAIAAELAALRAALAALDRAPAVAAGLRAEAAPRLARLQALAGDDDGDLVRWRALCAAAAAEEEALRRRCARLDDPAPLTASALLELEADHGRLARLATPAALPPAWQARLVEDLLRMQALRGRLARALAAPADDQAATAEAAAAAEALAARHALDADDEARLGARQAANRRRQEEAATQRRALAGRLAALDAPRPLPPGIEEDLRRYEALAGFADPAAQRWRTRFAEIRRLQDRLAPLAQASTPPADAAATLDALAALVGADDPQVAAGRGRLAAVAARRAPLAQALDLPAPPPAGAGAALDAYAALVGGDDGDLRRWRAKLAAWAEAAGVLAGLDAVWVLDPAALARAEAALAAARGAGGDAACAAWAARLDALRGPPAPAWAADHGRDRHGSWCELRLAGAVQRLRWLPPGTFTMGSPEDEPGRQDDEAPVRVRLERGCWIADGECGQALWRAAMGAPPGRLRADGLPVAEVTAEQADAFCARLAALVPGCRARLPSEAEWEAAARAGAPGPWGGLDPAQGGGVAVHRADGPWPAAEGAVNALGLRHMLGNLREWCADAYGPPPAGDPAVDPRRAEGPLRVLRGGSWGDPLDACRVANRHGLAPGRSSPLIGFRFACDP